LPLIQVAALVPGVHHITGARRLLQHAHLELAATGEVRCQRAGDTLELSIGLRVENGELVGDVVEFEGEVLPVARRDGDAPQDLASSILDLERVFLCRLVVDQCAGGELDLVVRVVGRFVPDVEVLVGEVQWAGRVLLDAEVQSLDALTTLAVRCVFRELQTCATEAELLLKDALVGDGYLDGSVVCSIEAGGCPSRKLQDRGPGQVVALDVIWVEERIGSIKESGRRADRDTAFEHDGTLGCFDTSSGSWRWESDGCRGSEERGEEGLSEHSEGVEGLRWRLCRTLGFYIYRDTLMPCLISLCAGFGQILGVTERRPINISRCYLTRFSLSN
jgi:hypothetical protein